MRAVTGLKPNSPKTLLPGQARELLSQNINQKPESSREAYIRPSHPLRQFDPAEHKRLSTTISHGEVKQKY